MAKKTERRALDLSKHVVPPGTAIAVATPQPIVSKKTGQVFPPPPPGGEDVQTATEMYTKAGKPAFKGEEWNDLVHAIGHKLGRRMCFGFARQRGIPCTRHPMIGADFCPQHGGKLALIAKNNIVTGAHVGERALERMPRDQRELMKASRPVSEGEVWERLSLSEDITDLRPDMASAVMRIAKREAAMRDMVGTEDQWQTVVEAFAVYTDSEDKGQFDVALLVAEIEKAVNGHVATIAHEAAIRTDEEHKSALQSNELKRQKLIYEEKMVEQGKMFGLAVISAVTAEVADSQVVGRIAVRVENLMRQHMGNKFRP